MMFASVFTKMLAVLSLVSFANAVIITPPPPDANMRSFSSGSAQGKLTNPTSSELPIASTSATQSMRSVEIGVAGSFTTWREIHFMDSIRNLLSTSTKVCLFDCHAFVECSQFEMHGD